MQNTTTNISHAEPNPAILPPTPKQMAYAKSIAGQKNITLPWDVQHDRRALSKWIDDAKGLASVQSDRPSSKQVAYAERIARTKRRSIPDECFASRDLMSRWIDANGWRR
jgi:hypothetical protein